MRMDLTKMVIIDNYYDGTESADGVGFRIEPEATVAQVYKGVMEEYLDLLRQEDKKILAQDDTSVRYVENEGEIHGAEEKLVEITLYVYTGDALLEIPYSSDDVYDAEVLPNKKQQA